MVFLVRDKLAYTIFIYPWSIVRFGIVQDRLFTGPELGDDAGDGGAGDVEAVGDGADREAAGVEAGDRADEFGAS